MLIKTGKEKLGNTRSEQCENLRRVYGGSGGMTDENLDKCKFLEKKMKEPKKKLLKNIKKCLNAASKAWPAV